MLSLLSTATPVGALNCPSADPMLPNDWILFPSGVKTEMQYRSIITDYSLLVGTPIIMILIGILLCIKWRVICFA